MKTLDNSYNFSYILAGVCPELEDALKTLAAEGYKTVCGTTNQYGYPRLVYALEPYETVPDHWKETPNYCEYELKESK